MGKFFDKKNDNAKPEDFVLMSDENSENCGTEANEPHTQQLEPIDASDAEIETDDVSESADAESATEDAQDDGDVSQDTALINVAEVSRSLDKKKKFNKTTFIEYIKTHRTTTIGVCAVLIAAIIAAAAIGIVSAANPLRNYVQAAAEKQNVMYTIDVDGTLNSGEKYEIMSLVSGTVAESKFEVGDEVKAGDTLYQLDDTEAKLAVERAKNELNRAKDTTTSSSSSSDTGRIIATDKGTIATLTIKQGSSVTAGSQIGSIKKDDGATIPIISYVSGTVSIVSAQQGRQVSNGQLIASVKLSGSSGSSKGNTEYDKKTGEIDVQAAQKQLENYTIKSPISGVVIEKNSKQGDNVGAGNSYKPMMVIMDTSKLSLTASVSDDVIKDVKKGQSVTITTDSISDTTFSGEVTNVGVEGKPGENGRINFDVTITIPEPGDLKSGMNVKARVILSSVKNVVTVPQSALLRTDGQNALVLTVSADNGEDKDLSETTENSLNNPEIKIPKGCELKSVKYGISDGNNVQIISGVKVGDIVAYNPDEDNGQFIKSNTAAKDSENTKSSGGSLSDNNSDADSQSDDAVKKEVKDKVNNLFGM